MGPVVADRGASSAGDLDRARELRLQRGGALLSFGRR